MKTSVVICEFNPLHTGHKHLLEYMRSISDKVICVMSGNFTQRAMPACCNKYKRAVHAVKAGADLVVELPTLYATAPAEPFALGGVKIANMLNADYLVFGSECGDINTLQNCAEKLDDPEVNSTIRQNLANGLSYPKAVAMAVGDVLNKPNNVLAVEYLRALKSTDSKIQPLTIPREDNFNGAPKNYASSTSLRSNPDLRQNFTFDFVQKDIDDTVEQKYCDFALHFLATVDKDAITDIAGISEGLHNRIFAADKTQGYSKMMEEIKTKRYTLLRLQRTILNSILNITKQTEQSAKNATPNIKVLAVKCGEEQLLSGIDNTTDSTTQKADRLYSSFDNSPIPTKIIKVQM